MTRANPLLNIVTDRIMRNRLNLSSLFLAGISWEVSLTPRQRYKRSTVLRRGSAASYPKSVATSPDSPLRTIAMLFCTIASIATVAFAAQGAIAAPALTVQQVVDNINIVATVSVQANSALSQLTTTTPRSQVKTIATVR